MKLLVRLHKDIAVGTKPDGIPDTWPAEVEETDDSTPDPQDGRVVMSKAQYRRYREDEQSTYDTWLARDRLPSTKNRKFDAIDTRTKELIAEGFEYASKRFSLSIAAQTTYTALYSIRRERKLVYPLTVNTFDDRNTHALRDDTEVADFYLAGIAVCREALDSGTALKDQVRAAGTVAAVNAVVDSR